MANATSFHYDAWAWQHASPTHTVVNMQQYCDGQEESISDTWRQIAVAIKNNPYICHVQLDIGAVKEPASVRSMIQSLASLRQLKSLHVKTLQQHHDAQTMQALHIVSSVAKTSTSLRHVHVQGLWFSNDVSTDWFCRLIQDDRSVREWTWSHLECTSHDIESSIAQAWSKNSSWTTWKLAGYVPLAFLRAAALGSPTTKQTNLRSLALESVTTHHESLWNAIGDLFRTNSNWTLQVRAMNLDEHSWRALSDAVQLSCVSFTHCCIDKSFSLTSLLQLVPSMELTWNRVEEETQLVELLNGVYQPAAGTHCHRRRVILYHHWCQVFDWDLTLPSSLPAMVGPVVQWKGSRWPKRVKQQLQFVQFLRDCHRNNTILSEEVSQHPMGSSIIFHSIREDLSLLLTDGVLAI
jgi:hypothetical protein